MCAGKNAPAILAGAAPSLVHRNKSARMKQIAFP